MSSNTSERRRLPRISRRAKIQFHIGDATYEGIVQNLSELGLHIQSNFLPNLADEITVPLPLLNMEDPPVLRGKVVWLRHNSDQQRHSFGVHLSAVPTEYLQFISVLAKEILSSPRGLKERFDAYHQVSIKIGDVERLEHTENISTGGIYVSSSIPATKGTPVELALIINGMGAPLEIIGRIAYVFTRVRGDQIGALTWLRRGVLVFRETHRVRNQTQALHPPIGSPPPSSVQKTIRRRDSSGRHAYGFHPSGNFTPHFHETTNRGLDFTKRKNDQTGLLQVGKPCPRRL